MMYQLEWQKWHGGAVVAELFAQVPKPQEPAFAHHMVRAALDLLVLALHLNKGLPERPMMVVHSLPHSSWHVASPGCQGLRVRLAIPLDDFVFWTLSKTSATDRRMIIVPPKLGYLTDHALRDTRKHRSLTVRSLDDYIAFRTLMNGLDAGWSEPDTTVWLLRRYNLYARRARTLRAPLIDALP
jgi:hypothetical protein